MEKDKIIEEFEIAVNLNFVEVVKARTKEEAIKKMENKYVHGKGRLPREYIAVCEYEPYFCQVED